MRTALNRQAPRPSAKAFSPPSASRRKLTIMAFKSSKAEKMTEVAHKYLKTWQPELGSGDMSQLRSALQEVVAPSGIKYWADGVVHPQDRHKSIDDIAQHIHDRHTAYKHVLHEPFCIALNEQNNTVLMGVRYVLQSTGSVAGKEATGRNSEGVLLEQLELDEQGKITAALVCRPLTLEERDALTHDPSAVKAEPLQDDLLYAPQQPLSGETVERMRENAESWVHCWDSGSPLCNNYSKILAPNVRQVSGYGLGKRSVPFEGIDAAAQAILQAHEHLQNVNTVINLAICDDRRAGFVIWQANSMPNDKPAPEFTRGFDYLRFDDQDRVSFIYSFTMRPYTNLQSGTPARSDKVD